MAVQQPPDLRRLVEHTVSARRSPHVCNPPRGRAVFGQLWRCDSCQRLWRFVFGAWHDETGRRPV